MPLAALIGAETVSLIGNEMTTVAIPWFVLRTIRLEESGILGKLIIDYSIIPMEVPDPWLNTTRVTAGTINIPSRQTALMRLTF